MKTKIRFFILGALLLCPFGIFAKEISIPPEGYYIQLHNNDALKAAIADSIEKSITYVCPQGIKKTLVTPEDSMVSSKVKYTATPSKDKKYVYLRVIVDDSICEKANADESKPIEKEEDGTQT